MKIIKTLSFALAFAATVMMGQTLTQKIDVTVVNVDVTVTGPDGKPVHGLTGEDFQLFEDGVAQPITNFYAIDAATPPPALSAAEGSVPAPASDPTRFRRKVLLLIDNAHISKHGRDVALDRLEKFIDDSFRAGDYDWSIAALGGHLGMVMPLTSDKQQIHDVLAAIRGGSARANLAAVEEAKPIDTQAGRWSSVIRGRGDLDNFSRDTFDNERKSLAAFTTNAIVSAARAFAAADGKKIILLLSDNTDFNDIELSHDTHYAVVQRNVSEGLAETARDIVRLRDRIIAEANASNVSIYVINPEGLRAPGDMGVNAQPMTNNQALYWIADQTGGRLMPGNDLGASIAQFESTSSNFYSLGFRPAHDDGKYHKLTVKLQKPGGYEVKYRASYSNVPSETQLERTLRSPITVAPDNSTLPVTLITERAQPQKRGEVLQPFQAQVPVSKLQFLPAGDRWSAKLDIYVSVFDENGKNLTFNRFTTNATADSANPDPTGTFTYRNGILMRKGEKHRIVVAFRDTSTDAVGVAERVVRPE